MEVDFPFGSYVGHFLLHGKASGGGYDYKNRTKVISLSLEVLLFVLYNQQDNHIPCRISNSR